MKVILVSLVILLIPLTLVARAAYEVPVSPFRQEQGAAYQALNWQDAGYFDMGDLSGVYFNHRNGFRITPGQPPHYTGTIWLMGNSQMYGFLVSDANTIPSALQRRMQTMRIVNVAVPGANTTLSLSRLKSLPIVRGDVVILMDGVSVSRALYYASKGDRAYVDSHLDTRTLQLNIEVSAAYTHSLGASFVWVLQPYLWSRELTESERNILVDDDLRYADVVSRPEQQKMTAQLGGIDLTHALDNLRASVNVYADHIHLNERGNDALAQVIYDAISVY